MLMTLKDLSTCKAFNLLLLPQPYLIVKNMLKSNRNLIVKTMKYLYVVIVSWYNTKAMTMVLDELKDATFQELDKIFTNATEAITEAEEMRAKVFSCNDQHIAQLNKTFQEKIANMLAKPTS